jgi:hypothetical protein
MYIDAMFAGNKNILRPSENQGNDDMKVTNDKRMLRQNRIQYQKNISWIGGFL